MKKKILAFVLTMLMICQLGVIAFADGPEEATIGSVTVTDTNGNATVEPAENPHIDQSGTGNQEVVVSADVSSENTDGVSVTSSASGQYGKKVSDADVTVKGDTEKKDTTVYVVNNGTNTDVDGIDVNVSTSWASYGPGTSANADVDVVGNIVVVNSADTTDCDGIDVYVYAGTSKNSADVDVEFGNVTVTNGDGIDVQVVTNSTSADSIASAYVWVDGNVTVKDSGSGINFTGEQKQSGASTAKAVIVVEGTVTGVDAAVKVNGSVVPTLIVGELDCTTGTDNLIVADNDTTRQSIINNIGYILNTDENITVLSTGTTYTYDDVYTIGQTVKLQIPDGYELVDGSKCKYTSATYVGNNTYEISVVTGGGLTFSARVKYVPVAYTTTTSVTTNSMKGDKNSSTQPIMVVNMKASHFQKVMVDGTDLAESNFVVGAKENGLLTFQFSSSYIKSLAAGTYSLQFVTTENVTYTMKLVMAEDGTYTVSF